MECHGIQWNSMELLHILRNSMEVYGILLRISMDLHGITWIFMEFQGKQWISMEIIVYVYLMGILWASNDPSMVDLWSD